MTEAVVSSFMSSRPLTWSGNPKVPRADLVVPVPRATADKEEGAEGEDGKLTKNQMKKLLKEQQVAQKKADKARVKKEKEETTGPGAASS